MGSDDRTTDWLQTYSGGKFYPLEPRTEDVRGEDIAHALSMLCRFAGHVARFYSVAEHCVLVSMALKDAGYDARTQLEGLLHDAAEAYCVDVPRPLKYALHDYRRIEDLVLAVIYEHYGVSTREPAVKIFDNRILLTERDQLMHPPPEPWNVSLEALPRLDIRVVGMYPAEAENVYFNRLRNLLEEVHG